jgi:hypothetical protein
MMTGSPTMNTRRTIVTILAACTVLSAIPGTAHGQIIYEANTSAGTVGEYDATTGAAINASLLSGITDVKGVAVSGGKLFVVSSCCFGGHIGVYDATTGATINASLVSSGLGGPQGGLALSGGNLYVTNYGAGTVGEYDATTGATINAALVSGIPLNGPWGVAVSGGHLYVTAYGSGTVGEYDATTGATINASLVSLGAGHAVTGIAVSGGQLFVLDQSTQLIGVYDATTGATINGALVSVPGVDFALDGGKLYVTVDSSDPTTGYIAVYDATTGATINPSLVSGLYNPIGIAVVPPPYTAQIQQPINLDGSSVFSVKRGVVPVKFTLSVGGVATCDLPPATISLIRTAGGVLGSIDESTYLLASDSGSNFRIDSANCQYIYNLATSSLGPGEYTVSILINGTVVGSGTFGLK